MSAGGKSVRLAVKADGPWGGGGGQQMWSSLRIRVASPGNLSSWKPVLLLLLLLLRPLEAEDRGVG